jgi:hypothetical protein
VPQFRLTQKFATDCKIKQLVEPVMTAHPLDDWFIDRLIIDRKKVAMITHGKSTFSFFIPYADAGGAKNLIDYFKGQLKGLFLRNSLSALALEVDKIFAEEPVFTKTVDRKILGHMNDFRRCSEPIQAIPIQLTGVIKRSALITCQSMQVRVIRLILLKISINYWVSIYLKERTITLRFNGKNTCWDAGSIDFQGRFFQGYYFGVCASVSFLTVCLFLS